MEASNISRKPNIFKYSIIPIVLYGTIPSMGFQKKLGTPIFFPPQNKALRTGALELDATVSCMC